jgi:hypothetical protein
MQARPAYFCRSYQKRSDDRLRPVDVACVPQPSSVMSPANNFSLAHVITMVIVTIG